MFFTVIIPVYKRIFLLERALKSVFHQSFQNFQCLVVIDGCDEDYKKLGEKYPKVTWLYSFPNKGVSFARNLGASLSLGKYLVFLDSDDEWLKNKLEIQYEYLQKYPVLWLHGEEEWYRNNQWLNQGKRHNKRYTEDFFQRSLETCLISPSTVCLERNFFLKFQFDESLKACEDYDLWLRMLLVEVPHYIEKPLIKKYGGHDDQLSQQHSLDFYRIQSLKKIYTQTKKEQVLRVLLKKYEIFIQGGEKRTKNMDSYKKEYRYYVNKLY